MWALLQWNHWAYAYSWDIEGKFFQVCAEIVAGSVLPILTSLKIARLCNDLKAKRAIHEEEFQNLYDTFTTIAIDAVNNLSSDLKLAMVALHQEDEYGQSPLKIAIQCENVDFLTSITVDKVLEKMWFNPR